MKWSTCSSSSCRSLFHFGISLSILWYWTTELEEIQLFPANTHCHSLPGKTAFLLFPTIEVGGKQRAMCMCVCVHLFVFKFTLLFFSFLLERYWQGGALFFLSSILVLSCFSEVVVDDTVCESKIKPSWCILVLYSTLAHLWRCFHLRQLLIPQLIHCPVTITAKSQFLP